MRPRTAFVVSTLAIILLPALAAAAENAPLYPEPVTDDGRAVKELFDLTFLIAMIVFVGVEALLFYIIWRFRANKAVPHGEQHRGHTGAEIAWTIVPAVILLGIGTVSAVTLFEIDEVPTDADVHVRVIASQFIWVFNYTDGGGVRDTINELRVETGKRVSLEIVSKDVEHQFFVPQFAMKISAIPGRTNEEFFVAPAPGSYHFECSMYCGFGHHEMGAASEATQIVVFPAGTQSLPYGRPLPPAGG